jgi:pimeloyl-ACP methyl ester carboxylesterase
LHGKNQNRRAGAGVAERYVSKGFAVLAFDQRAHGASDGTYCTYGIRETDDLRRILDRVATLPVFVIGESLGVAVALQATAVDTRIQGVVAAASFADLESAVRDRTGNLRSGPSVDRFEREAGVRVADASPKNAARHIRVPVLLIHGARDRSTPLHHSKEIFAALAGPKELLQVEGAGHGDILKHPQVWEHIDRWLERVAAM